MARTIINYYEVGKKIKFSNGLKVQVVESEKKRNVQKLRFW